MTLETDRLILRNWDSDDAPAYYNLAKDPEIGPLCGWKPVESVQQARATIIMSLYGSGDFAIILKETQQVIGGISLKYSYPVDVHTSEIGYWLGRDYWGNHYVGEALEKLLEYAFLVNGKTTLWVGHYVGNERSKSIILKAGFVYVRTAYHTYQAQLEEYRDCVLYKLTKKHWLSLHPVYKKYH